jgi:predicted NUDIX family phosphoesterase
MEQILVVPTAAFHNVGYFQGFSDQPQPYLDELLQPKWMSFRPRDDMERDPSFKQLIPYVIFRYRPAGEMPRLFCYTRGKGQGEKRLHSKLSVGVGGHISSADVAGGTHGNVYLTGMQRELDEEVRIDVPHEIKCVGLINDDQTEVGGIRSAAFSHRAPAPKAG